MQRIVSATMSERDRLLATVDVERGDEKSVPSDVERRGAQGPLGHKGRAPTLNQWIFLFVMIALLVVLMYTLRKTHSNALTVIKPSTDTRSYRGLVLSNGLTVLLVSDPETSTAAASLSVSTGNWHDPIGVPGLAHFCEHLMFMGSARYPKEDAYFSYVLGHGGATNGFTISEETNFHFKIEAQYLFGALDRFSSVFVQPLLREESMAREMLAIQSEFSKNYHLDERRFAAVLAEQASSLSPLTHFTTGSIATLNHSSIHSEVVHFNKKHFHGAAMKLVVIGRDHLDKLEHDVKKLFSAVPAASDSTSTPHKVFEHKPFISGVNFPSLLFIKPMSERFHVVNLYWPLSHSLAHDSHHLIGDYVCALLESESEGSFAHHWRERGVVNSVNATLYINSPSVTIVQLSLSLNRETVTGSDYYSANRASQLPVPFALVVQSVFHYIHALLTEPTELMEKRYNEWRSLLAIEWEYGEWVPSYQHAVEISTRLLHNDLESALRPPQRLTFHEHQVVAVLQSLNASNVMIHVASPATPSDYYDKHERWYGTQYSNQSLPAKLIDQFGHFHPPLTLPHSNPFVPNNFTVLPQELPIISHPTLLFANEKFQLYHNQADHNQLPLTFFFLSLSNNDIERSIRHYARLTLYVALVRELLATTLYEAEQCGYSVLIQVLPTGLSLSVSGISQSLPVVLDRVLVMLFNRQLLTLLNHRQFSAIKSSLMMSLRQFNQKQAYQQAIYLAALYVEQHKQPNEKLIEAMQGIDIDGDWDHFIAELMDRSYVQMFTYGNVHRASTWSLAHRVLSALNSAVHDDSDRAMAEKWQAAPAQPVTIKLPSHTLLLPKPGVYVARTGVLDGVSTNSAVIIQIIMGHYSNVSESVMTDMLALLMSQPLFDELRTKQQLGYIVHSWAMTLYNNQRVLRLAVQSGQYDAALLFDRLYQFLLSFHDKLKNLTHDRWLQSKGVLTIATQESNDSLREKAGAQWSQILTQEGWQRKQREIEEIKQINFKQLLRFYRQTILDTRTRRIIVVEMEGKGRMSSRQRSDTSEGVLALPDAINLPLTHKMREEWKRSVEVDRHSQIRIHLRPSNRTDDTSHRSHPDS